MFTINSDMLCTKLCPLNTSYIESRPPFTIPLQTTENMSEGRKLRIVVVGGGAAGASGGYSWKRSF